MLHVWLAENSFRDVPSDNALLEKIEAKGQSDRGETLVERFLALRKLRIFKNMTPLYQFASTSLHFSKVLVDLKKAFKNGKGPNLLTELVLTIAPFY